MKKAIALLTTLVVMAGTTFAQLAPTLSGSAETKFGFNFDKNTNGFETSTEVTVTVPVVTASSKATEGEDATGSATITGSTLTFTFDGAAFDDNDSFLSDDLASADAALKGTDASISAKLDFANGFYATVGANEGVATDMVTSTNDTYDVNPQYGGQDGMTLGFDSEALDFAFTILNETDGYEIDSTDAKDAVDAVAAVAQTNVIKKVDNVDAVTGVDGVYHTGDWVILGATASYDAGDMFAIDAAFGTTAVTGTNVTGVSAKITSTPAELVTIAVPVDFLTEAAGSAFELRPTVDFDFGAATVGLDYHFISVPAALATAAAVSDSALAATVGFAAADLADVAVTLGTALESTLDLTAKVVWTADVYTATVDFANVLGMDNIGIDGTFTGIDGVSVSAETNLSLKVVADDAYPASFTVDKVNVDFADAFTGLENTVVTVNYSGFNTDGAKGTAYAGVKISL